MCCRNHKPLQRENAFRVQLTGSDEAFPLSLREGLPINFIQQNGVQRILEMGEGDEDLVATSNGLMVPSATASAASTLAQGLRDLADMIEINPQLIITVADDMASKFYESRLPPPESQMPKSGPTPTLDSVVCARGVVRVRLKCSRNAS